MFFSVLLVIKNEEHFISRLLDAVLKQDFPQDQYEIIVVDGQSTDRTNEIVHAYMASNPNRIRYFTNEKGTLPAGWNIGIQNSRGKYIIRLDGHSLIPKDFLNSNHQVINSVPDAVCVGGTIQSVGEGFWGRINSYVYSHPIGVGNSMFRIAGGGWEGYVDTVPYGAYQRSVFDEVGLFNESLRRNEDLEMHARIRRAGGRFYLSSKIHATYFVRSSMTGLIMKSLNDGKWTMVASRKGRGVLRFRHLLPLFMVVCGLLLLIGSIFVKTFLLLLASLALLYCILIIMSSVRVIKIYGLNYFLPTILTFAVLHFSRGFASFFSLFSRDFWYRQEVL